jgi:hypothetical protein
LQSGGREIRQQGMIIKTTLLLHGRVFVLHSAKNSKKMLSFVRSPAINYFISLVIRAVNGYTAVERAGKEAFCVLVTLSIWWKEI